MCTVLLPPGGNPIAVKYIISYHIISYHIVSYHIIYIIYHILYHITSHVSYRISYIISYRITSYHAMSYHITSYHIITIKLSSTCFEEIIIRRSVQAAYSFIILIVSAARLLIKMHGEILPAVCTELLLMMKNYFFRNMLRIIYWK
jgi:hypothetical protein